MEIYYNKFHIKYTLNDITIAQLPVLRLLKVAILTCFKHGWYVSGNKIFDFIV
jgi:hypothetical protein